MRTEIKNGFLHVWIPLAQLKAKEKRLTGKLSMTLEMVRAGAANKDIANKENISESAAKHRVSSLLTKFGVTDRRQL
jgi:DNA-binding NarL/FixJ family response regulator